MANDCKGLTVIEVGARLGLKVRTVRQWVRVGKLHAVKVGNKLYIKDDLNGEEIKKYADVARKYSAGFAKREELGLLARGNEDTEKPV